MDPQDPPGATAEPAATTPHHPPKTLRYVLVTTIAVGLATGVGALLILDVLTGLMP